MPVRGFSVRASLLCFVAGSLTLAGCTWTSDGPESTEVAEPLVTPIAERELVPVASPTTTFAPQFAIPTVTPTLAAIDRDGSVAGQPQPGEVSQPAAADPSAPADPGPLSEPPALFHAYEVQEGDTLSALAERFGIEADYLAWNNQDAIATMLVGAMLRIPAANGMLHSAVVDQPLWTVAALYGTDIDAITSVPGNDVTGENMVMAGSIVLVAGARPLQANPPRASSTVDEPKEELAPNIEPIAETTPTATPTSSATSTPSPVPALIPESEETPATQTPSPTPEATHTPTPTPTAEATRTPTPIPAASETPTPSPTPQPELTPARTVTATPTAVARAVGTPGNAILEPSPTATAIRAPTTVATPRPSPTSTPEPGDPPKPRDGALTPGTYASVEADGECLYLRDQGDLGGRTLACIATGTIVSVLDGAVEADGYRWQKVSSGTLTGWAADIYLEPSAAPPPATASPRPTPTPTPTRVTSSAPPVVLTSASLKAALAASPWPVGLWPTVERIIQCESSGNPNAVGPGGHRGLMQVDPTLHGPVPADPVGQLTQAYSVYKKQGWGAWACY